MSGDTWVTVTDTAVPVGLTGHFPGTVSHQSACTSEHLIVLRDGGGDFEEDTGIFFFFFNLFRASPAAYRGSQARG